METKRREFKAYTDGSCDNLNPLRPGGSAYIIFDSDGKMIKKASKGFSDTTNNRMELLAIISVVNSLPNGSDVTIYTDSEYCILALKSHNPIKNLDQIALYKRIVSEHNINVKFVWVKGHNNNKYNELCDKMARGEYTKMCNKMNRKLKESEIVFENHITTKGRRSYRKRRR